MNKKKMIFLAILGIFAFIIIVIAILMMGSSNDTNTKKAVANDFKIWILDDSKDDFMSFISDFKKDTWNSSFSPDVESFDNYEEYNLALASAIIKWEAPDLYMLNNNEKSIFLENAVWIDPKIFSPDDLRTYFNPFFGDDLILSVWDWEEKNEFLVGVPLWYETLGLYFNFQRVWDVKKIKSFSSIVNFIDEFHNSKPGLVALWIGRWTTVENVSDIIAQFLMADQVKSVLNISSSNIKNVFSEYFDYAWWNNNYSRIDDVLKKSSRTNLDYFVDWEIAMMFGYPRLLEDINERWFSRRNLSVINFPDFVNDSEKLVNYNYFVLNKDSKNEQMAYSLLEYMFSEEGQKKYLNNFKYYLPSRISLYADIKDKNINDAFNVKLKNFFNSEASYSSFDKWLKIIYDREIKKLLDDEANYLDRASDFIYKLKCKTSKIIKLEKLSDSCG